MALDARFLHVVAPGFYRLRLVQGGPWVPVRVSETGERDELGRPVEDIHTFIEIDGADIPPERQDFHAERINLHGEPITEAEYRFMRADADWCKANAPADPKARPRERVDLNKAPTIF